MKVFAARKDDVNEGFVWLKRSGLPSRCVVKITNPSISKFVYCEALQIDQNFLNDYNNSSDRFKISDTDDAIVMGGWFRAHLGDLVKQNDYQLVVATCNGWWGKFRASAYHPQVVVRVGACLGVIGVGLGFVGAVLGLLGVLLSVINICPKA